MNIQIYSNPDAIPNKFLEEIKKFDIEGISDFFNDPFTFNIGIIVSNNHVVGCGIIRVINEFKMTINPEMTEFTKARIISSLMNNALNLSQCNEVLAFVTLPKNNKRHYAKMLEKHFRFEEDKSIVMRLEK